MATSYRPFWVALLRASLIAAAVGGVGALLWGAAVGWAFAVLVMLIGFAYYAWKLNELNAWLAAQDPASIHPSQVPEGMGVWGETLTLLYKQLRLQRSNELALTGALDRFQQAANALPDGVVMLDNQWNLVWCNPTAEAHWQISLERDRFQTITYFIRHPDFQPYLAARDFNSPITLRLMRSDGLGNLREAIFSVQLIAFGEEQMLLLSRDISERERIEAMRRDFVANVSHELRTPLTVMAGFVETLATAPQMSAEQRGKALDHLQTQTQRMQRLVDDLLALSRLEDAQNKVADTDFPLNAVVHAALEDARQLSAGRHQIRVVEQATGLRLKGGREEIFSAISNLANNAVRYTPPGGEVRAEIARSPDGSVKVSIVDTGEGIDAVHIPRLTERFYRVDRGRSRESGGTGLGLAIVKHVALRHNATLEIESSRDQARHGSTFSLVFPAERVAVEQ